MTPEVQAVLRAKLRSVWWGWWPPSPAYWLHPLVIVGVSWYYTSRAVIQGVQTGFDDAVWSSIIGPAMIGGTVGGVVVAMTVLFKCWRQVSLAHDARAATYLRTTGPVESEVDKDDDEWNAMVVIRVGSTRFTLSEYSATASVLKDLSWAEVDYTRHERLILSIRNGAGCMVYCEQGLVARMAAESAEAPAVMMSAMRMPDQRAATLTRLP